MAQFSIQLKTKILTKQLQEEIDRAGAKRKLKLNNITINTRGLAEKIQRALDGHNFTLNLTNVKVDNLSKTITGQMRSTGEKAAEDFTNALISRINTRLSNGGFESSIAKLDAQYEKLFTAGMGNSKIHGQLLLAKNDIQDLRSLQKAMADDTDPEKMIEHYNRFNSVLERTKNELSTATAHSKKFVSGLKISNLDNKISIWMEKNSKATRDFGGRLQEIRKKLAEFAATGRATAGQIEPLEQEFSEIQAAAAAAGQTGKSFASVFEGAFKRLTNYFSISTVMYQVVNGLKQMYQNVYNIDTQMTELKKVTDETEGSYNRFLKSAATTSKQIGTTISDLVSSTADFARLGYSFEDSQELAKVANIYNVVGDEIDGIDDATKSIISTMTAFKNEISATATQGEFALSIVDKFNAVGKQYCPAA